MVVGSLSTVASGLGFISGLVAILKQGIIWTKFKTIAQSVWSFIRRVKQTSSTELGHIVTPVEFFDYINKIFRNNELGISKDVHEIQNFFMSQNDKVKRLISQKFCDILMLISIISPGGKQNFAPMTLGNDLSIPDKDNQINFDELVQTPYLRGLLLPIIPEKKLKADFNWKKIWVWKEETIDDFKKHIGLEITDKLDKYLDKQSKVIADRFKSGLKDLKDFGKENAEILFKAMDGPGTDEEVIYSVFDKIKSEDYFWSIYLEFGLRQENDLIEWLFGDLNENDLYELSIKLKKQIDWKEGWDVSEILKSSLEEYHKNNPDWSISISKF